MTFSESTETQVDMRWQWNPEIRERWANERLYFWRLAFPTYDQLRVVEKLEEVMRRVGVKAYAVYELYGGYDILLRVWLPTTQRVFEAAFHDVFQNSEIVIEEFSVKEVVTHWPWAEADGSMRLLDEDVLATRISNEEITRINAGPGLGEVAEYQERGMIAPSWHSQGIKFIVLVGASRHGMPVAADKRLRIDLLEIVRAADDDVFAEKSIYQGIGFCGYLILGRVRSDSFHLIERDLVYPINEIVAPEKFGSRTTTFTMSTEDFLAFSETMAIDEEAPRQRSAAEWLAQEEGQLLEVKGSAFADYNKWLNAKPPTEKPPLNDVAGDSLLKAITGFLNAEGGAIVLGALETERYAQYAQFQGLPVIGSYLVPGLQVELGDREWNWDKYERALRDLMAARIDHNPNRFVHFYGDGIDSRPVCVLTVREPPRSPTSGHWFYHCAKGEGHPRFWVREGNRTIEKEGNEIVEYQREKTRRATGPS
jgi:hypothetical protein